MLLGLTPASGAGLLEWKTSSSGENCLWNRIRPWVWVKIRKVHPTEKYGYLHRLIFWLIQKIQQTLAAILAVAFEVWIELTEIRRQFQQARTGKDNGHAMFAQVGRSLAILQGKEIFLAVDEAVHVDDGSVVNEVADIAAARHADDAAWWSVFFKIWQHIHVGAFRWKEVIRHDLDHLCAESISKEQAGRS